MTLNEFKQVCEDNGLDVEINTVKMKMVNIYLLVLSLSTRMWLSIKTEKYFVLNTQPYIVICLKI